jgi:hypothetical protein
VRPANVARTIVGVGEVCAVITLVRAAARGMTDCQRGVRRWPFDVTGPERQLWRYIGADTGVTSGALVRVSDGTRVVLGLSSVRSGKDSFRKRAWGLQAQGSSTIV